MYQTIARYFTCDNEHEQLLYQHALELSGRLTALEAKDQGKYTLSFTDTEALAFVQLWKIYPIPTGSHAQVIVGEIIGEIDRAAKAPKRIHQPSF